MISKSAINISIIISTFHRSKSILKAIKSLQKQTADNFEIIVVGCDDQKTKNVISKFNKKAKIPVDYFNESRLGLHNARHLGAKKAKGDLLIYTDDDCTFSSNWIRSYEKYFVKYSEMAASGGPVIPIWEETRPEWLIKLVGKNRIFLPFSLIKLKKKFTLSKNGFFFGGNMAIRKKILFDVRGFNPDNFGGKLFGDGDTGLNNKLRKKKLLIGYVPGATVYHHISKERLTRKYLFKWMEDQGRCDVYSLYYEKNLPKNWFGFISFIPEFLFVNIKYWLKGMISSNFSTLSLNIKLNQHRTASQVSYIKKLMYDKELQALVVKKNWL